jgi:hypothetical protein
MRKVVSVSDLGSGEAVSEIASGELAEFAFPNINYCLIDVRAASFFHLLGMIGELMTR